MNLHNSNTFLVVFLKKKKGVFWQFEVIEYYIKLVRRNSWKTSLKIIVYVHEPHAHKVEKTYAHNILTKFKGTTNPYAMRCCMQRKHKNANSY